MNCTSPNALVKIFANCNDISMCLMLIILLATNDLKWWYFRTICVACGLIQGCVKHIDVTFMSLNTVQWVVGTLLVNYNISCSSLSKPIRGVTSLSDCDSVIYYGSDVERLTSV